MKKVQKQLLGASFISLLAMSSTFATGLGGNFPATASVPTLSGTMLIILSVLLFAFAYRISKQHNRVNKLFVSLLGVGILLSVSGGIKLISDTYAVPLPETSLTEGLNFHNLRDPNNSGSGYIGILNNSTGQPITGTLTPDSTSRCFITGDIPSSSTRPSLTNKLARDPLPCGNLSTNIFSSETSITIGAGERCYIQCASISSNTRLGQ